MAKKYFVFSDVHGHCSILKAALEEKGFDIDNPEHIIISCGDIFDRGDEPLELFKFLTSIPKERRILIRGNHEYLLRELVERERAYSHDESNGTYKTLLDIAGIEEEDTYKRWHNIYKNFDKSLSNEELEKREAMEDRRLVRIHNKVYHNRKLKKIINWIFNSGEWANYFETDKYIFVHCWVPVLNDGGYAGYTIEEYREDWRNGSAQDWETATWGCPWSKLLNGLNKTGKTIVCGHWHTSDIWNHLDYSESESKLSVAENPIYRSDKHPELIGLDACTAYTKEINVLVLDESEL